MSLRAVNVDWRKRFQWALEIDSPFGPINIAQILKCNTPKWEIEKSVIKQAGALNDIKAPGRIKYDDLKMERILLSQAADLQIFNWFKQGANAITGKGIPGSQLKRNVDLVHLDDAGDAIERWKLFGAWCCALEGDDLEGSSDPFMEKVTICYDSGDRAAA